MSNIKPKPVALSIEARAVARAVPRLDQNLSLSLSLSLGEGVAASPISRPRIKRVILACLESSKKQLRYGAEINLRLCHKKEALTLNLAHRGKNYAPNVLTFEYPSSPRQPLLSDIAICMPVLKKEALQQNKTLEHHFIHLLVHGCLHAIGYDHLEDDQATIMENLERQILRRFRIGDPYITTLRKNGLTALR
jgi:probable rRNA maturation factor